MAESGTDHRAQFIVFGCPFLTLLFKPLGGCMLIFEYLIEFERILADKAECWNDTWIVFSDANFSIKFKIANINGFSP